MAFLLFLFLLVCYWFSGHGLLHLFGMRLKPAFMVTLSLLLGIAVASVIPFILQLFYIVLTGPAVFGAIAVVALLLNIPLFLRIRREGFAAVLRSFPFGPRPDSKGRRSFPFGLRWFKSGRFRLQTYELPFLLIIAFMTFVSVWRCYYFPPTSRDALSGPEAIAEYAVREQSMINSFFSIDLWSTNNQFKSPFLISLQLIYKLAGFPFGQIWLSIIFVCFTIFLYQVLKERLHPILAGLLLLLFTMSPEIYAYSFMILYDYSNMVFYFLGIYFLFGAATNTFTGPSATAISAPTSTASIAVASATNTFTGPSAPPPRLIAFAGLLLGIATYIRSETLALVILLLPVLFLMQLRSDTGRLQRPSAPVIKKMAWSTFFFLLPSGIGYYLPTQLYIKYYLPVHYDIGALLNPHLTDWHPLFQRYGDIITKLLYGTLATHLWGYLFYCATALFLAELLFIRRFSREARNWLYAMLVLYLALGAMGFALPMFNLLETTKRALFKMMPLALLYLANNEIVLRLSHRISRWEAAAAPSQPTPGGSRPNPKKKHRKK